MQSGLDDILKELEIMRKERKRDKIFSKLDSLFFVLVTMATFFSGIIIAWHQTLIELELMPYLISVPIALLIAFLIGFKGMINDDTDTRILSWAVLVVMLSFLVFPPLLSWVVQITALKWFPEWVTIFAGGFITWGIGMVFSRLFIGWVENSLSSLLGERITISSKVSERCLGVALIILVCGVVLGVLLSELIKVV